MASLQFSLGFGRGAGEAVPPETPMRIGILGNFSGGQRRNAGRLDASRVHRVDLDRFAAALAELRPTLRLPAGGNASALLEVSFGELDDFHPDALYDHVPLFAALRNLRARLQSPTTFAAAARELGLVGEAPAPTATAPAAGGSLFNELIGAKGPSPAAAMATPTTSTQAAVQALLKAAVSPYIVPKPDPRQEECLTQIDAAIAGEMRRLLHQPEFQALEELWRGVEFLLSRLELDEEQLQLHLVDLTRAELDAALAGGDGGAVAKLLADYSAGVAGDVPWGVLVVPGQFGAADLGRLSGLARVGMRIQAPVLAAVDATMLGGAALVDHAEPAAWPGPPAAWTAWRQEPEAKYLMATLPRFLLRLPYGRQTDRIERFDFAEVGTPPAPQDLLWGSGAWLGAVLLGQAYLQQGWDFAAAGTGEVGDLPLCTYRQDGDAQVVPCAEVWLTERAAERLSAWGLAPLQSLRNRDAVRLEVRGAASAGPSLGGRWRG